MTVQRFFITDFDPQGEDITFPKDIAHQIHQVLRMRTGDRVVVLDGKGGIYQVEITRLSPEGIKGNILEKHEESSATNVDIHLFFPLSRREKVEWILQKDTEIGVSAFHPFTCERSLVQESVLDKKRKTRWESIIREAAEQCRRNLLPDLYDPQPLDTLITHIPASLTGIFAACVGDEKNLLKEALNAYISSTQLKGVPPAIGLFVGPEGGFSEREIQMLSSHGAKTVSLGSHILRMETAAIVFPAQVIYELNDFYRSE